MSRLSVFFFFSQAPTSSAQWAHDWATPSSAFWGYGAMNGGGVFSDDTVAFAARTYRVVVLSACLGQNNASVSATIAGVAARLKAVNPAVRVLQYFNMQQWACYNVAEPAFAAFLAHPEWWLKSDTGNPIINNGSPEYDWTVSSAVDNFLSMPVSNIDGFLLDGGAVYQPETGVGAARAEAQKLAKWLAMGRLQARLTALNGGILLANGMAGGPIDPFVNDPFNLGVLAYANAVENERGSPAFEQVDSVTGALNKNAVAANLAAIEGAAALANGTKVVALNYWPGPITRFPNAPDATHDWPAYAPSDPVNHTPNGTSAQVVAGWTALLEQWFPFNLAAFLTVAGPSSYFSHNVWYAAFQGFAPCPATPDSCVNPLYPDLSRPLGPPLGPRTQVDTYKWVRTFEHAVVTLDLDEPLGPGTSIVWTA